MACIARIRLKGEETDSGKELGQRYAQQCRFQDVDDFHCQLEYFVVMLFGFPALHVPTRADE